MSAENSISKKVEHDLLITRVLPVPPSQVFQYWTRDEHLRRWQGAPHGFTVTSVERDFRPGGFYKLCMRSPEGLDHWLQGEYREIVEPERLVLTHSWLDGESKPGKETLVTITFTERDGRTELALYQSGFKSVESRDGHREGWNSTLDRFSEYVNEALTLIPGRAS